MSKTKSITDYISELQRENESLKFLGKLATQYCKHEFGYTPKELHEIVKKHEFYQRKKMEKESVVQAQHIQI